MKLKVCGITDLQQLIKLDDLNVDMAGFIFYPKSPRYVLDGRLRSDELLNLDLKIKKVGVFVNAGEDEIFKQIKDFDLDIIQLHGQESPEFCAAISSWIPVIKAFRLTEENELENYQEVADYFLFDSGTASKQEFGGTGHQFDWELLKKEPIKKPFFLSGGLGPDDTAGIKKLSKEIPKNKLWAVDINSRFETAPGIKDLKRIEQFINDLKS
ncbi:MAG: phosphoribosylanthranilate isomerase [Sphingobacteriaceae bacterium]